MKTRTRVAAWFLVVQGVVLMFVPAWLSLEESVTDSMRAAGPLLAASGFLGSFAITHPVRWFALPVGLWLLAAPVFLPHPFVAAVISIATGLICTALMLAPVWDRDADLRYGGGWRSLWRSSPSR